MEHAWRRRNLRHGRASPSAIRQHQISVSIAVIFLPFTTQTQSSTTRQLIIHKLNSAIKAINPLHNLVSLNTLTSRNLSATPATELRLQEAIFHESTNKAISLSTDTSALYVSQTQRQRSQTPAASRAATISHTAETL